MRYELVGADEVMTTLDQHRELWLDSKLPELAELSAMLTGESVRRAIDLITAMGFVIAREVDDAQG